MTDEVIQQRRGRRGGGCVTAKPKGQKKIWELRWSLGKRPDGKRRTATAIFRGSKNAARAELNKRIVKASSGEHVDPSRMTVSEFIEHWLTTWAAFNVSGKTAERYGELLRGHVAKHKGALHLQKLQRAHLSELYALLRKPKVDGGAGLGGRTVLHVHRVLSKALKHAKQEQLITNSPAEGMEAPKAVAAQIEILTADQVKSVLSYLQGANAEEAKALYPLVQTALGTGMRRGELCGLRWTDLAADFSSLRVARSVEQTKKGGLKVKAPKTKHGQRTITLPATLQNALRALKKAQLEKRIEHGLGKLADDAPVFPAPDWTLRRPDGLTKAWVRAAASMNVDVSLHSLRHTHASQLISAGMDILSISRRLGHVNVTVTLNTYGHLMPGSDERAAGLLEAAFFSEQGKNLS